MNTKIKLASTGSRASIPACAASLVFIAVAQAAFTPFSDPFDTDALDVAAWNASGSSTSPFVSGSPALLRLNANTANGDYSTLTSVRSDFDPFANGEMSIALSGITLGTNNYNTAYARSTFYVAIGNTAAAFPVPDTGKLSLTINYSKGGHGEQSGCPVVASF